MLANEAAASKWHGLAERLARRDLAFFFTLFSCLVLRERRLAREAEPQPEAAAAVAVQSPAPAAETRQQAFAAAQQRAAAMSKEELEHALFGSDSEDEG